MGAPHFGLIAHGDAEYKATLETGRSGETMTDQSLGALTRVDLRDIWTTEANDFTPWLALPENLAVLRDTLGIELDL